MKAQIERRGRELLNRLAINRREAVRPKRYGTRPGGGWLLRLLRVADEGGALVEFAMVLPMLMLFMTGIATFGIVLNQYSTLTEATNVAGRYLAFSSPLRRAPGHYVSRLTTDHGPQNTVRAWRAQACIRSTLVVHPLVRASSPRGGD